VVLSYAELDGRILGWAFDDGGIQDFVLDVDPPRLRAASERFRRLCSDPSSDLAAVHASGRQRYDWLIQPVRHRLRGGRNKFLARIASDWKKPDGLFVIQPEEVVLFCCRCRWAVCLE